MFLLIDNSFIGISPYSMKKIFDEKKPLLLSNGIMSKDQIIFIKYALVG